MVGLDHPLKAILGGNTATSLAKHLHLRTVGDLLRHYPRRYEERGQLTDLASLRHGEHVTIQARVLKASGRKLRPKLHKLDVDITDGSATLTVTFFNSPYLLGRLTPGTTALFAGKVGSFKGRRRLTNPTVEFEEGVEDFAGAILPIYPIAGPVKRGAIVGSVRVVLDVLGEVPDPLPRSVLERRRLVGLNTALRQLHRPDSWQRLKAAQARLRYEEAFLLQVALAQRRAALRAESATVRRPADDGLLARFDARLPFELTDGQRRVAAEIEADLASGHPMHRLLQGEVGSGKTVVALRAMLAVVDAGGQAALLAPTEVLAQQHHRSITAMLGDLAEAGLLGGADRGTRVALLTGSQGSAARRKALLEVASGEAGIVIGTHALLQDPVDFFDLGLVVIDEQHRFGVEQRDALRAKAGKPPHTLVMTATPIPRTVAMTVFGDLEVSTLTELPPGRSPIATHVVPAGEKPRFLERTWERVREEVALGRQAYVVCPRIGGDESAEDVDLREATEDPDLPEATQASDLLDAAEDEEEPRPARRPPLAVLDVAPMLQEGPLAGLRIGVLHGRLAPEAKDATMRAFAGGELDVLVATTVVEVGVDVPNATVMVVLDADAFGVSQLHQLRGRVGRGSAPGLCLLVTDAEDGSPSRARLDAVASTVDGFALSRFDLETRREGDVLGATQSGRRSSLNLLRVIRDEKVINVAREDAEQVVSRDPQLQGLPALRAALRTLVDDERADYLEKA